MAHRMQVLPAAMLWGAGTAVGEIPPYAFSYHAAKAGMKNEEWDSIFAVRPAAAGQGLLEASINRMKSWMLGFIQRCALGSGLMGLRVSVISNCCCTSLAAAIPRKQTKLAVLLAVYNSG